MQRVGFVGMGLMGSRMAARLAGKGVPVTVWNRTEEKARALEAAGCTAAKDLRDLCRQAGPGGVVMLSLSDTRAVESVVSGCLGDLAPGTTVVDFSSIDPDATRALADRLAAASCTWVDAPVSGGTAGAESGTLAVMAGGDADVVDRLRPLLAHVSSRVTHMGPAGSGQVTKVVNQVLVTANLLAMAEMFALAEKAGVDAARIPDALRGGFASSPPLDITGPRMAAREFADPKWTVKTLLKDLDLAQSLLQSVDPSGKSPLLSLTRDTYTQHALHHSAEDPATLIQRFNDTAKSG
ncbi:2-hydroxy-3-oxopropionate reductase [Diplonema papillatum]|nr:2-hydroxy-3-oxopropionate reductase [Diplonema papillatum]